MRCLLMTLALLAAGCLTLYSSPAPVLVHSVFFTLRDPGDAPALERACRERLGGTPGMVAFAVGPRAEEFDRPVNDTEFHVSLQVWFEDREAFDDYLVSPPHVALIEEFGERFEGVRVFDAWASTERR